MSNFLWHHGLYSPRNSPGQKLEWVAFPCAHGISKVSPCTWSPLARGTTQRCLTFQDWFLCSYPILQFWSLGTGVMLMPKRQWCWKLFLWIFFHQRKSLFHLHKWRIVSLNIGFCFCFLSCCITVTDSKLILLSTQQANKWKDKVLGQKITTLFQKPGNWEDGRLVS